MRQQSTNLIVAGDMSANITSTGINLISIYAYSIQATWTGSAPVGVFSLQGSNDAGDVGSGQGVSQPIYWTTIASSNQSISGGPGSILYDVTECSYRWVRLIYIFSSGAGTLRAVINTKGV
jgi:hypothetical protein